MGGFTAAPSPVQWSLPWESQRGSTCSDNSTRVVLTNSRFVDFAMHRVRMLQHYGVTPYIIFDGDYLPSKAATEADRSKRREESRKAGLDLLSAGKTSQAYLEFQKAVDVTPEMARQLIDDLKRAGVQYVVAPYEADAQMVYLERKGIIDGILSEDSDLLVFGAKCLLTKLDQYGNCIEINKADFCAVREISLAGWSDVEFRRMAILSGCDYLASINNMGLKTAYRMVRKHKTIEKIIRMLQFDGKFSVPKGYLEAYQRAEFTFLHQRVFCPEKRHLVYHTEPQHPLDDANMPYLGKNVDAEIAQGVARGDLNPITKLPIIPRNRTATLVSPFTSAARNGPLRASSFGEPPKKETDINTYFKAKRIPLAELDINCFTPSPSQQDALQRNSGPWDASPVPRPYLNRSLTEVAPQRRSISTPNLSPQASLPHGRATRSPTITEARPNKRARLCEDIDSLNSSSQTTEVKSRFFGVAEPSPSTTRGVKSKKSRKHDVTIFSDDSIEEAMLSIVEASHVSNSCGERQSEVGNDETVSASSSQTQRATTVDSQQTSQESIFSNSTSFSNITSSDSTVPPTSSVSYPTSIRKHRLSERFSTNATTTPQAAGTSQQHGLPTPTSTGIRPSRIPLAVKLNSSAIKPVMTPLQRLGISANNKTRMPFTPPMTPVTPLSSKSKILHPPSYSLNKNPVPFPEVVVASSRSRLSAPAHLDPLLVPLPAVNEDENLALQTGKGSEDLIIHDSEDEEPLSPIESVPPKLNLSKFVFAG